MTAFKDSQEAAYRRLMRNAVRRGGFSKSERDVCLAIVNLWLHHKNGPKAYIHPSRKSIARKAEVSVRTVATVFALLRETGVLVPISRIKGGRGFATRYKLDELALFQLCGLDMDQIIAAMTPVKRAKLHGNERPESVQKLHTVYKDVSTSLPSQERENIVFLRVANGDAS